MRWPTEWPLACIWRRGFASGCDRRRSASRFGPTIPGFGSSGTSLEHDGIKAASDRGLSRLAGEFLTQPLDRSRPLWSILVVPRAGTGRAAVLGKVHHAMVDGLAAVELGMLLFDLAPDAALPEPADWRPAPADPPLRLAVDSVADGALEQFRMARRMAAMGLVPGEEPAARRRR